MIEKIIAEFNKQFEFKPEVVNGERLPRFRKVVVGGMGGSHLAADILKQALSRPPLIVHSSYGLPVIAEEEKAETLFIAASYSGNTEETFDFAEAALEPGFNLAAVTVGGKLLEFAQKNNLPYIELPKPLIPPRMAGGFMTLALSKLIGDEKILFELGELSRRLNPLALEDEGQRLAERLLGRLPVIYSSAANGSIALNWKIRFNETAQIPAFFNVFPEVNHNEMAGFEVQGRSRELVDRFHFIFLFDKNDHPRIAKRMAITKKIFDSQRLLTTEIVLEGGTVLERVFNSIILADWTAYFVAGLYGTNPDRLDFIENFKKSIKD